MIRRERKFQDVQSVLVAMLQQLTSSGLPWSDWEVVPGWPGRQLKTLTKPVLYVLMPRTVSGLAHFGGGRQLDFMVCEVGAWDDRKTGGPEEISIIMSELTALFGEPQRWKEKRFNVTLSGQTYENVTLIDMGIRAHHVEGPREMMVVDEGEFRSELSVYLTVGG